MRKNVQRIGIVGLGNMGRACAVALAQSTQFRVYGYDIDRTKNIENKKITGFLTLEELITKSDILILAVKPQNLASFIEEAKDNLNKKNLLLISILAGIPTCAFENFLKKIRVIRAMPNIPAKIGQGMSCLCVGRFAKDEDIAIAEKIFKHLGKTLILNESMMDAATAISGSGPGYLCDFIENNGDASENIEKFKVEFEEAAQDLGFDKDKAIMLVDATTAGTLKMLTSPSLTASQLKEQIKSKGGTTEAGLEAWHQKEGTLKDAVKAAAKRAKELSK